MVSLRLLVSGLVLVAPCFLPVFSVDGVPFSPMVLGDPHVYLRFLAVARMLCVGVLVVGVSAVAVSLYYISRGLQPPRDVALTGFMAVFVAAMAALKAFATAKPVVVDESYPAFTLHAVVEVKPLPTIALVPAAIALSASGILSLMRASAQARGAHSNLYKE